MWVRTDLAEAMIADRFNFVLVMAAVLDLVEQVEAVLNWELVERMRTKIEKDELN